MGLTFRSPLFIIQTGGSDTAVPDGFLIQPDIIKNYKTKFRTMQPKSIIVGATTGIYVASDFTTHQ